MSRRIQVLGIWLLCVLFSGCATRTSYNSKNYTETRIQDNIFRVSFTGEESMSADVVEDFALLRCAETTLKNDYTTFVITEGKTEIKPQRPRAVLTIGNNKDRDIPVYFLPTASFVIQCFKGKTGDSERMIYDAKQVKDNIKAKYGIK